jgi:hypothetical protein
MDKIDMRRDADLVRRAALKLTSVGLVLALLTVADELDRRAGLCSSDVCRKPELTV